MDLSGNDSELRELREQVYEANIEIFRAGLVTCTAETRVRSIESVKSC